MRIMKTLLIGLVVLTATTGLAQTDGYYDVYIAELTGDLVVPESGSTAYGDATLVVPWNEGVFSLLVNYIGLDSPPTGITILAGAPGEPGTVLVTLPVGEEIVEGQYIFWSVEDMTPEIEAALENEQLAVQIQSELLPNGAIRGNMAFDRVPTETSSWSQVKGLF
jgi:hypothetical protein